MQSKVLIFTVNLLFLSSVAFADQTTIETNTSCEQHISRLIAAVGKNAALNQANEELSQAIVDLKQTNQQLLDSSTKLQEQYQEQSVSLENTQKSYTNFVTGEYRSAVHHLGSFSHKEESTLIRTLYGIPLDMIVRKLTPTKLKNHKGKISFAVQALVGTAIFDYELFPRFMAEYKGLPLYDRCAWSLGYVASVASSYLLAQKASETIANLFTKKQVQENN